MPLSCELCGNAFGPRDSVCRVCGTTAGQAASSSHSPDMRQGNAEVPASAPLTTVPDAYLVAPQSLDGRRGGQNSVKIISGCAMAIAVVGAVMWTASALWRMGPGGEIAFAQHNRAGNQAFERGDFHTADAEYSAMIALRPRRADGYLLRAINDYKTGMFPQAIRDNTDALAQNPVTMQRASIYFNRAESYFNRKAWGKAVEDYTASEQAYQQASAEPGAYAEDQARMPRWMADVRRGRARASLQMKNYAQTIADYSANIGAGTVLPEDYGMRAEAEEALGHDDRAAAGYGKSICMDAAYMYGYQRLERMVDKSHRYEQAVAAFRKAAEAHPESALCWGSLGWYEHVSGHLSAAIAADARALSLDPEQTWIAYNLGLSCALSGDSARASKAYAAALRCQNQDGRAASFKELQNTAAQHPDNPALQNALRQVREAVAANPGKPASATSRAAFPSAPGVDAAFESLLAADTKMRGYALRPPAGYMLKHTNSANLSGSQTVDLWRGPARPDGSAPDLQVTVTTDDGRQAANATPRQMMQEYLDTLATNHAQFKASPITNCVIGGRTFLKATWSGVGAKTGKPFSGFAYYASQTGEYVSIVAHDTTPNSVASLPLLEASTRTFRK